MKKDIHPSNYREVAFKDMSNEEVFITRSTVNTKETIEIDGTTYPLVKPRRHRRSRGQVHAALRQPQEEIRRQDSITVVSARGSYYKTQRRALPNRGGRATCYILHLLGRFYESLGNDDTVILLFHRWFNVQTKCPTI